MKASKPDSIAAIRHHSAGYVLVYAPDHPLKTATQLHVYQHRVVLYDAIGDGPHSCHWCSKSLDWPSIEVDHLNSKRNDNRLSNLVVSCSGCNGRRGNAAAKATKRKRRGLTLNGRTQSIPEWAAELGLSPGNLRWRLNNGWSEEDALSTPRSPSRGGSPLQKL